jgi:hypothetical protein
VVENIVVEHIVVESIVVEHDGGSGGLVMEKRGVPTLPQAVVSPGAGRCPVAHGHASADKPVKQRPQLLTASQVDRLLGTGAPLAEALGWVRSFLAQPHPDLGRTGPVCPFVPVALELDTIWCGLVTGAEPDPAYLAAAIGEYRELFLELEPRQLPEALNKAILIVFPNLGPEGASAVDEVQRELKPRFVEAGLMLGEFHAANESPGLRNPDFRPLRSPVPMLAIRNMVESDLPFLRRSIDPPGMRAAFVRSYLRRLGSTVSRNSFSQAIDALVEAEFELRRAAAELQQEPAV